MGIPGYYLEGSIMDYSRIITRSFEIAWKYKSLWVFGLFASGGWSNFNLDMPTREIDPSAFGGFDILNMPDEMKVMFVVALFAMILVFVLISFIAQAAIIDSVNRIDRGGRYRFSEAFSAGLNFFLRFLGLALIAMFSFVAMMAVIILPVVLLFQIHTAVGVLSLLFAIPASFFCIYFLTTVFNLADRVIVVRDCSIGDGLEEAYLLFKKNMGSAAILFLLFIAFSIGFAIVSLIVWGIFGLPLAAIGLVADMEPLRALILGVIVGLPISLIVGGFMGVFFSNLYTLFYFELVDPASRRGIQAPPTTAPLT